MIHKVDYNSQRNNVTFGTFSGHRQCFTSCSWMLMSYYTNMIDGTSDRAMSAYFDDVEDSVGKAGIGEKIKQRFNWIKGNTSYWWAVQQFGITEWLNRYGVSGHAVFADSMPMDKLIKLVDQGPVIVGTKKLGGLPGGHIILLIGYESGNFMVNDPYGNAMFRYKDHDGEEVLYSRDYLNKYLTNGRCIFWSV